MQIKRIIENKKNALTYHKENFEKNPLMEN